MKIKLLIIFFWIISTNLDAQRNQYFFSDSILINYAKDSNHENAATLMSFIGEHKKAKEIFTKTKSPYGIFPQRSQTKYAAISAIDFIREKSKTEQIVIINEAHHIAQHRVFTTKLLKVLFENGFKYFSTETLTHTDISRLNQEKFPNESSGYYTAESSYGNLIREAASIGFEIFAYESEIHKPGPEDIAIREVEQAKNIKKILEKDPSAKIFVHCGFGHHMEMCVPELKLMGCLLFEFTGINPFTIDQIKDMETLHKENKHNKRDYQNIKYSVVLVDSAKNTLSEKPLYDLSVFHPKDSYIYERPIWLIDSMRRPYFVSTTGIEFPSIFKAYIVAEYKNSKKKKTPYPIPIDVIEMKSKNEVKALSLKKGKYILEIYSNKQTYQKRNIFVEE